MNKKVKSFLILTCLIIILIMPYFVFAGNYVDRGALDRLKETAETSGPYTATDENTASKIAGTAVAAFLGVLGVIFIILMVYGGYNWMIARGNEEKVEKAKQTIYRAIIGVIIVASTYAIYALLAQYLFKITV